MTGTIPPARPLADRLLDDVVRDPGRGCWLYTGFQLKKSRYGQIGVYADGEWSLKLAHRVSYELFCGPIPAGLIILHECDVRPCVNPGHLTLGTYADNVRDALAKGRHSAGERHPISKLTASQVEGVRRLIADGETYRAVAGRFGISHSTVRAIAHGRSWRPPPGTAFTRPVGRRPGPRPRARPAASVALPLL